MFLSCISFSFKIMFTIKILSEPSNQETFSTLGKTILEDDATADFSGGR